jgi:RNA polymerase sigma-70 factor (ECF subfamily)
VATSYVPIFATNANLLNTQTVNTARNFANRCRNASTRLACLAAGIVGDRRDAEDIVQQAILIAIEKNGEFESESHFLGWLAGIVRNCALNHRRKSARRKTQPTDPADMVVVDSVGAVASPVDRETGELKPFQGAFDDRLNFALQQIAPKARSCLLLRIVEGLDYKEISLLMDMPEGTAMNLVHRSKKKLRDILECPSENASKKTIPSAEGENDE